jgi:hypothetical protein
MIQLDQVTDEDFRPFLQQSFRIADPSGGAMDAVLVKIAVGQIQGSGRRQFSLLFRGAAEPVWPQKIYSVENGALGKMEIFLVPVAKTAAGTDYEAVFA